MNADAALSAILAEAGGNATEAQRRLIMRLANDFQLLKALTLPYLRGIAAHAISRAVKVSAKQQPVRTLDDALARFAEGFERPAEPDAPRPVAPVAPLPAVNHAAIRVDRSHNGSTPSPAHAEAIRALAKAQARQRLESGSFRAAARNYPNHR